MQTTHKTEIGKALLVRPPGMVPSSPSSEEARRIWPLASLTKVTQAPFEGSQIPLSGHPSSGTNFGA